MSDKIKSLLPSFNDVELIILVVTFPLNVTQRLYQHEANLVRECTLVDRENQAIFGKLCRVILMLLDVSFFHFKLLKLFNQVYFFNDYLGAILFVGTKHIASESDIWLFNPEYFKPNLFSAWNWF